MKKFFILFIFSIYSQAIFSKDLATSQCKDCEDHIKFAQNAQKKIKETFKKGIVKVVRGTKTSPCGEVCRYTNPLTAEEIESLTKAYKTTQTVMLNAWEEIKKREIAARLSKCNNNICPNK